jgi:hypothetical protein
VKPKGVEKILSPNDIGETGAHQAGIVVPKTGDILTFFPTLDRTVKNPRSLVKAVDDEGKAWSLNFIYYNNRFFGGTRNEFRLTGLTAFFREFNLKANDVLLLWHERPNATRISFRRKQPTAAVHGRITLAATWKVIDC